MSEDWLRFRTWGLYHVAAYARTVETKTSASAEYRTICGKTFRTRGIPQVQVEGESIWRCPVCQRKMREREMTI